MLAGEGCMGGAVHGGRFGATARVHREGLGVGSMPFIPHGFGARDTAEILRAVLVTKDFG